MKFFKILMKLIGWKVIGVDNLTQGSSVVTVAPHTSFRDGVIGYIVMKALGVNFRVISAEWLFFFPMKYIMKYVLHARPCGPNSGNAITASVKELHSADNIKLVICPEGHLRKMTVWPKGFYVIAKKSKVPIDIVVLNYKTKTVFIRPAIATENTEYNECLRYMRQDYRDYAYGYYPEKFALPEYEDKYKKTIK